MGWILYSLLFLAFVLLPIVLVGVFTGKKEEEFLGKSSTNIYKGIAILGIMLCHSASVFGQGNDPYTPLGGIGVAIFLMLSAYGLCESYKCAGGVWNAGGENDFVPYVFLISLSSCFFIGLSMILTFWRL